MRNSKWLTRLAPALLLPAMLATAPGVALAHPHDHYGRDYHEDRPVGPRDRIWRGDDGRYHCRRSNGTTGLLIGAGVGALVGRSLDSGGDHATGTILGAAGGALLGRSIDRNNVRCR
ncbi:hypothetical protein Y88_1282 [Novosphingobium nitrogenifigens DSM 19370]|jgi:hypothetical protein|uniref:17 kDa surface antigen n=1 Tax=Novosphingobium nitrogenifigens DSM 19370 TaxID=983920 RepID=F1Z805_9SPHN|nr:glycine zipper 2TM domain-containing protein [Novosphingobium nitrogenifigens]EGD59220.1 hypothetical protein Y88_1282 [Novosphingobium nitrogenifigens DSM 19370]